MVLLVQMVDKKDVTGIAKKLKMHRFTWTIGFFCTTLGFAQPKFDFEELKKKFPDASAVVFADEVLHLDVKGDELLASRDHTMHYVLLDEKALGYAERSVTYIPGFFEFAHFEANTYVPNGKSFRKIKVQQWEDKNRISNMFFFDDVKYREFVFPGVQKGAVLELKYTYKHLDPSIQFPFHFQEGIPMIKGSFTMEYTDKVKPYIRFFGDTLPVQFTQNIKSKITTKTWEVHNVDEWKGHANAPSHNYNLPHLFPLIHSYKTETKGWQSGLTTTKDLYAHNYRFIKDLNKDAPDPELKRVVDSIQHLSPTKEELVRNIYYWVQDNMKYIAFEDGLGGFVPRQANDIFRKRYGDCKDMSSLLTFMYKTAGFPAYLCWIGTRDLPYSYTDLPLPNSDNHMIAAVYLQQRWQFLDATARFLPYGYPSGFIQGKEALVAIAPDSFQVVKVPTMPAVSNSTVDSTYLSLTNESLLGNILVRLDGYNKYYLAEQLMLARSDKKEEMMEKVLSRGSNKCKIFGLNYQYLADRDQPLLLAAKMELRDYAKLIDGQWYVNMNLDKSYQSHKIDTTNRTCGREFDFSFRDHEIVVLEIPKGYKVKKMPPALSFEDKRFAYDIRYRIEANKVVYHFSMTINTLLLQRCDFIDWNKHIDKIVQAYKEVVVLEKTP